jgi:hypothetical protein
MLLSLLLLLRTISPSVDTLTSAQRREDLHFIAAEMARLHRNVYHQVTRQQFDSAVADLDARIPTLSREQILTGFARIVALVGDGHTHLPLPWDSAAGFGRYPVALYRFADGLYVTVADRLYAAQLNVREHPRSSDAEAYLAEGYARAGKTDLAIAGFERAIVLDPTNSFALTRPSELHGGS